MTTTAAASPNQTPSFLQTLLSAEWTPRAYSGRGMGGETCLAVSMQASELGKVMETLVNNTDDNTRGELAKAARWFRTESLGHDIIVYFPHVKFVETGKAG